MLRVVRTSDFEYELPAELIAQTPEVHRDQSRLLVVNRNSGTFEHKRFSDFPALLRKGDVLVLNDSRVIPARLHASNANTRGRFELLLVEEVAPNEWWAMMRPGKRARAGTRIRIHDPNGRASAISATVTGINEEGHRFLRFEGVANIFDALAGVGEVPLPPYIERTGSTMRELDSERYQTVYAKAGGSVAAPTAGLHFTATLLDAIRARGVSVCFLTLHVGLGTFAPVKADDLDRHIMHEERYDLGAETAQEIQRARAGGGRVVAVGTTTMRVLETVAASHGRLSPGKGKTRIFIYPPYQFKFVNALLTNFHLPRSTLLMLVSAFAAPGEERGLDLVLRAYREAIRERYRFFSYGDAMFLL